MEAARHDSQDELAALRAVVAEQAHKLSAQETALNAEVAKRDAIITILRAQLDLLRHGQHGASSEKIDRKIEQYELMLEEIEAARAESDALAGRPPLPERSEENERAKRKPLPDTLAMEDTVYEAPCSCPTCGGSSFLKAADKVTKVLEHAPASVKVVRHVEKRMVCRTQSRQGRLDASESARRERLCGLRHAGQVKADDDAMVPAEGLKSSPVLSIVCMITESFRATATAARLNPSRSLSLRPQVRRLLSELTRVRIAFAAS